MGTNYLLVATTSCILLLGCWPSNALSHIDYRAGLSLPASLDQVRAAKNFKHSARFGLPSRDNLRLFNDFVLSYDRRLRSATWAMEHLNKNKLAYRDGINRDESKFHEDEEMREYFRATNSDYLHSSYDRGHLAAAANHKGNQQDLDQTFTYSNISPQTKTLNRGLWEKLEKYVRWRAYRSRNLYAVSGPLYLPIKSKDGNLYVIYRVIGSNQVSVPTHYFKVFLVETNEGNLELEAFLMPNDKLEGLTDLNKFRVNLDESETIERSSGLIFFD